MFSAVVVNVEVVTAGEGKARTKFGVDDAEWELEGDDDLTELYLDGAAAEAYVRTSVAPLGWDEREVEVH